MKRISNTFPILKEARREVLEDVMDFEHTLQIIQAVNDNKIEVKEVNTATPSPFAFDLIAAGYSDVIRIEDKHEFLRRMHQQVLATIALKDGKKKTKEKQEQFSYQNYWEDAQRKQLDEKDAYKEKLKMQVWNLKHVPIYAKEELVKLVENGKMREDVMQECKKHKAGIEADWPAELKELVLGLMD